MFIGRATRFAFSLLALLVMLVIIQDSAAWSSPRNGAWEGELHPDLRRALRDAAAGDQHTVWILFTDKGLGSEEAEAQALEDLLEEYHPRAVARRSKVRPSPVVDTRDLPLYEPYVQAVAHFAVRMRARSKWLNGVSAQVSAGDLRQLASLPFTREIREVPTFTRPRMRCGDSPPPGYLREAPPGAKGLDYGQSWTQLDQVQVPDLHDLGLSGAGVLVGVLDTGFYREHEALEEVNVIEEWDFINDDPVTQNEEGDDSYQHFHGTLILSLLAGDEPGELMGPAYGADFVLGKTEEVTFEEPIEEDWYVEGLEWAESLGADIVSTSLGYTAWYSYEDLDGDHAVTTVAVDIAAANGVLVVTAMGNHGDDDWFYLIAPADADSVVAVGAVYSDGTIAEFSSRGPAADGRIKPEVVAMGVYDYAAYPDGYSTYGFCDGTSCATPIVAGTAALILEGRSHLTAMQLREAMMVTATQSDSPDTVYGWGILQGYDALHSQVSLPSPEGPTGPTPTHRRSLLLSAHPNPGHQNVRISFLIPGDEMWDGRRGGPSSVPVVAKIFDARGRLVTTLLEGRCLAGRHSVVWDGSDSQGNAVGSGVYFCSLSDGGGGSATKIVITR